MRNPRVVEILSILAYGGEQVSLPSQLCACLSALPVSGVGAALMTVDGPSGVVLAATDEWARQLEELQFALGEGPCVEASDGGRPVLEPDLVAAGSSRWPQFGVAVLDAGVRAVFAFPLRVGVIRVGVLDLYRDTTRPLTNTDLVEALAFADAATEVHDLPHLLGGHRRGIVPRRQPHRIQWNGPGTASGLQRHHDRVGPAGHHDAGVLAPSVGVAEDPLR